MAESLIYPGGGDCDPNPNPCVGPNCGGPGGGSDPCAGVNPPPSCNPQTPCLYGCEGDPPNVCTGPDCENPCGNSNPCYVCVGPNCSWGEDGQWNVYWRCELTEGVSQQVEVIVMLDGTYPTNDNKFNAQQHHYSTSGLNLGSTISIGDSFQVKPELTSACYTYLGKKHADSPGNAVPNGIISNETLWAVVDNPPHDFSIGNLACTNCIDDPEPPPEVNGCLDPTALNYSTEATIHDQELCCYVSGCVDPTALNFNETACIPDNAVCCYISGCDDPIAVNYNAEACFDDSTCCYVSVCTQESAYNYDPLACYDDGSCTEDPINGFVYGIFCIFDMSGVTTTYWTLLQPGVLDAIAGTSSASMFQASSWGCTDQVNEIPITGIEYPTTSSLTPPNTPQLMQPGDTLEWFQYNSCATYVGTINSAVSIHPCIGSGCNLDLGSGVNIPYFNSGPCPPLASAGNSIIGRDFTNTCGDCCDKINDPTCGVVGPSVTGCDEPLAANYNPLVTVPNNATCEWNVPRYCTMHATEGQNANFIMENLYMYGDETSVTQPDFSTGTLKDNIGFLLSYFEALPTIAGSTPVPSIPFYTGDGINSNGAICFVWVGWDTYVGDGSIEFNDTNGYGISTTPLNTGPTIAVLGPYGGPGTTSTNILNNGIVGTSEALSGNCGTCGTSGVNGTAEPSGCTNPVSPNYDPFAVIDDGSCRSGGPNPIGGCMDPLAGNYDPTATQDDGSCDCYITMPQTMGLVNSNADITEINFVVRAPGDPFGNYSSPPPFGSGIFYPGSAPQPNDHFALFVDVVPFGKVIAGSTAILRGWSPVNIQDFHDSVNYDLSLSYAGNNVGGYKFGQATLPNSSMTATQVDTFKFTYLTVGQSSVSTPLPLNETVHFVGVFYDESTLKNCNFSMPIFLHTEMMNPGCTNSAASNYNSNANVDDGSCT